MWGWTYPECGMGPRPQWSIPTFVHTCGAKQGGKFFGVAAAPLDLSLLGWLLTQISALLVVGFASVSRLVDGESNNKCCDPNQFGQHPCLLCILGAFVALVRCSKGLVSVAALRQKVSPFAVRSYV